MFERMLVGGIENRITLGLLSFVLTMVFLGWAAINEGGRMQAFQLLEEARSIEQGAMTYAANCTACHGLDGRGNVGRAPGLNNPQFFGHDFFPEISREIAALRTEKTSLELEEGEATDERKAEIRTRVTEIDTRIAELNDQFVTQTQAAVDNGYGLDKNGLPDATRFSRLNNLGWVGTHTSFIQTTLIHGRPVSVNYWDQPMAAWSQIAGGPLRMDQIEDLVAYIENFDKGEAWTLEDLFAVRQFAREPIDPALRGEQVETVGTDITAALEQIALLTGDPARGDQLYHGGTRSGARIRLACSGCHIQAANGTGPMTDGTYTRVSGERLQEAQFASYTAEQYLVESILRPANYITPGYTNVMPANFGEQLTTQDLADIIAYLQTMNQ
jgi:mono/diheme cytochrome c family protein